MTKRPSIEKSAWLTPGAARHLDRVLLGHRLRVAEVQTLPRLGDHDRGLAVGREVHVVRVVDRERLAGLAGLGVDRRQAAVGAALGIVGDPQRLQVPRRHDVLRADADLEAIDHLQRRRIDHVNVIAAQVGHIDAREVACDRGHDLAGSLLAVEVLRIEHRRHAGHRGHRRRRGRRHAGRGLCRRIEGNANQGDQQTLGQGNAGLGVHESGISMKLRVGLQIVAWTRHPARFVRGSPLP